MRFKFSHLCAALLVAGSPIAQAVDCCTPTAADWPKYGGNLGNTSFSSLEQINTTNVRKMAAAWHVNVDGGSTANDQQGAPVVVNGVMYVHSAAGNVTALNAKTGAVIWKATGLGTSRGVAVGQGLVFVPTRSPQVITALNQATGAVVWKKTAADLTAMGANSETINGVAQTFGGGGAPGPLVYYNGLLYVGTNGGDSSYRGRGFALNAADGSWKWTFWGAPAPGKPGGDTWAGNSALTGGSTPWMHPAIDVDSNTLYWTWGNAWPNTNGTTRAGDNLYSGAITAIDATTGAYKWHFQAVHHDLWDYDLSPGPILYETVINGQLRKAVAVHGKTGWLYILDRLTGEPLIGIDETPVGQNAQNNTAATQPIPRGDPFTPQCPDDPNFPATKVPPGYDKSCTFVPYFDKPGVHPNGTGGGGDWGSDVYDPRTNTIFIPAGIVNSGFSTALNFFRPLGAMRSGTITALNGATNRIVWQKKTDWSLAHNHLLGTAGNLLFVGQPDGFIVAMDSRNGNELWRFQTGAGVHGSIISYQVDGEQYISVLAGGNGLPYSSPRGDHLWAFKLNTFGHGVPPAPTPPAPSMKQPITAAAVAGSTVGNTVLLARTSASSAESTGSNSMFPQHMTVPLGTTVTFLNKADSTRTHCAVQFFDGLFSIGPLAPGQSGTYTFTTPGEYFYNDGCSNVQPNTTGKIVVQAAAAVVTEKKSSP